jgi:hypothetical protein
MGREEILSEATHFQRYQDEIYCRWATVLQRTHQNTFFRDIADAKVQDAMDSYVSEAISRENNIQRQQIK